MLQNIKIRESIHISKHQVLHFNYILFLSLTPQKKMRKKKRKSKKTSQEKVLSLSSPHTEQQTPAPDSFKYKIYGSPPFSVGDTF